MTEDGHADAVTDAESGIDRDYPSSSELCGTARLDDWPANKGLINPAGNNYPDDRCGNVATVNWPCDGCVHNVVTHV